MNDTANRLSRNEAYDRVREGEERRCPAGEFFDQLSQLDQIKLMALFLILGDHGKFYNPEKFGDLGGGLFEFKSFQIRMPFAYAKNEPGLIFDHARLLEEEGQDPREEIARAWRIYEEDQGQTKLSIVGKAKR